MSKQSFKYIILFVKCPLSFWTGIILSKNKFDYIEGIFHAQCLSILDLAVG